MQLIIKMEGDFNPQQTDEPELKGNKALTERNKTLTHYGGEENNLSPRNQEGIYCAHSALEG